MCYGVAKTHTIPVTVLPFGQTPQCFTNPWGIRGKPYKESDCLHESGSNWTFWKTQIVPFMTGAKLWPYISRSVAKPEAAEADKLTKWRETDAQALSIILMNISPNVQAGLDYSSSKAAWDGLLARYVQTDPIAKNLAQTRLHAK